MHEGRGNERGHDKAADAVGVWESVGCPCRPEQEAGPLFMCCWLSAELSSPLGLVQLGRAGCKGREATLGTGFGSSGQE